MLLLYEGGDVKLLYVLKCGWEIWGILFWGWLERVIVNICILLVILFLRDVKYMVILDMDFFNVLFDCWNDFIIFFFMRRFFLVVFINSWFCCVWDSVFFICFFLLLINLGMLEREIFLFFFWFGDSIGVFVDRFLLEELVDFIVDVFIICKIE